ncbi:hypothetical protein DY251_17210 [Mesorhizobium denitrificans]|uniref:Uncharacterized protein n=2 Tax=Phyllobacteriaceae TaxID=69277 RepID=A0A371X965_9HYPH|nr:hypothetical protein DY251_17210 [Mesorhizobium denitrificans]
MLRPFSFRIRNPQRDKQTDAERFKHLATVIDETIAEVAAEQEGLDRRYKLSQSDAALLMMASDNDDVTETHAHTRLSSLEATIIACEERLKELGTQKNLLQKLRGELQPLLASKGDKPTAG